ncbi:hypothetical protein BJV82DRAFT_602651 [Fennellomyces sp. T-0311]|nr:hypothetical protein BJV82DRAFT_602651 [Fennellomyces sp. T-0311]
MYTGSASSGSQTTANAANTSKPLFSQIDTSNVYRPFAVRSTTNNSNNTMLFTNSTATRTPASIPLQPSLQKQETSFNMDVTATASRSSGFHGLWSTPPSFFVSSSQEPEDLDMDVEPATAESTSSIAFGEGKSLLRFSQDPQLSRYAGHKRESTSTQINERRVSFKRTVDDEGKGKARADDSSAATIASDKEETESVYVFGFARNTEQTIIDHFGTYGKILDHHMSTGNWIVIRYHTAESAEKALKSNGTAITGNHIIGVTRGTNKKTSAVAESSGSTDKDKTSRVIPFDEAKDLYKKPEVKKAAADGLGSGKAGLSVLNVPTVNPPADIKLIKDNGVMTQIKDFFREW